MVKLSLVLTTREMLRLVYWEKLQHVFSGKQFIYILVTTKNLIILT